MCVLLCLTGIPQAEGSKSKRWYDGGEAQRECAPHVQPPLYPKPKPDPSSPPKPKLKLKPTPKPKPDPSGPSPHTTGTNNTSTRRRRCGPSRPLCTRACRSCSSGYSASSIRRKPKERHCNCHCHSRAAPLTARETSPQAPSPCLPYTPPPPPRPTPSPPPHASCPQMHPGGPLCGAAVHLLLCALTQAAVVCVPGRRGERDYRQRSGDRPRASVARRDRPRPPPLETERGHRSRFRSRWFCRFRSRFPLPSLFRFPLSLSLQALPF